jgi:hypothetical protein
LTIPNPEHNLRLITCEFQGREESKGGDTVTLSLPNSLLPEFFPFAQVSSTLSLK